MPRGQRRVEERTDEQEPVANFRLPTDNPVEGAREPNALQVAEAQDQAEEEQKAAEVDPQWPLIDVSLPGSKEFCDTAHRYKKAQKVRLKALAEEIGEKKNLLLAAKAYGIKPDTEGVTRFKINGVKIKITPRDELVSIKFDKDTDEDDE